MARQLRIVMPGGVYHLIARGNERKNIFRDDVSSEKGSGLYLIPDGIVQRRGQAFT
jgi:REP element-mobilizing transposase RayT